MAEEPERHGYSAAHITPLTLREAVKRRPGMYFGTFATSDWPLVILAWTVLDLLDLAPAENPVAEVTVRSDGSVSASVRRASVFWPARAQTAADAVRLRQWWTQLCRDVNISVTRDGQTVGLASAPTDDYGHRTLVGVDITVAASVDPEVVSAPPATWWINWLDGLPDVAHRIGFEFTPRQQIIAVDEASGNRLVLTGDHLGGR
jgi:hypothetical protein